MELKLPRALLPDTCVLDKELKPVLGVAVEKIGMASMAVTGCVPRDSSRLMHPGDQSGERGVWSRRRRNAFLTSC